MTQPTEPTEPTAPIPGPPPPPPGRDDRAVIALVALAGVAAYLASTAWTYWTITDLSDSFSEASGRPVFEHVRTVAVNMTSPFPAVVALLAVAPALPGAGVRAADRWRTRVRTAALTLYVTYGAIAVLAVAEAFSLLGDDDEVQRFGLGRTAGAYRLGSVAALAVLVAAIVCVRRAFAAPAAGPAGADPDAPAAPAAPDIVEVPLPPA